MDRFLFLKEWERISGISLSEQGRANFIRDCSNLVNYSDSSVLEALRIAKKNKSFDLESIKAVAAKIYEKERLTSATSVEPIDSSRSSYGFSGLSSGFHSLGSGDYYEYRERRKKRGC